MKKIISVAMISILIAVKILAQGNFSTLNGRVSFFASAPVADVDAVNEKTKVELNTSTHEISVSIAMADFQFKSNKMGRDAEKKYLETKKYPNASFQGKLNGNINYQKPGTYPVTASGKLSIHGVEKQVNEKGTVTVSKEQITLQSEFNVSLKDYNIETPKILGQEMTSESVQVKIKASLKEKAKKPLQKG
jgi:polyisoprenoid-binding protein YceI